MLFLADLLKFIDIGDLLQHLDLLKISGGDALTTLVTTYISLLGSSGFMNSY